MLCSNAISPHDNSHTDCYHEGKWHCRKTFLNQFHYVFIKQFGLFLIREFQDYSERSWGVLIITIINYHCQWDKGGKGLVLTSPSLNKKRGADGVTIGDDICK